MIPPNWGGRFESQFLIEDVLVGFELEGKHRQRVRFQVEGASDHVTVVDEFILDRAVPEDLHDPDSLGQFPRVVNGEPRFFLMVVGGRES